MSEGLHAKAILMATSGTAAAAASSLPTYVYGHFLTSRGFWLLSYAEWIQVIGSLYVMSLLVKTVIIPLVEKIREWFK